MKKRENQLCDTARCLERCYATGNGSRTKKEWQSLMMRSKALLTNIRRRFGPKD